MRLRRDTIRVEKSAVCADRLSLHRLPAKRRRAVCHLGICVSRKDLVVTRGEPRKIAYANRIRSFAACCGTHLFFEDTKEAEGIDVTIASLDDPASFAPQKAIFLEDKLPWVKLDESIPSFPKTPKTKANQGRHGCHGFRMGGSACPQDDAHSPKAKIKIRRLPAA